MDHDAEQAKVQNDLRFVEAWQGHPITKDVSTNNRVEQENTINYIINRPVGSVEDLVSHFQAIGYLNGLRRSAALVQENVDEFKAKLNTK